MEKLYLIEGLPGTGKTKHAFGLKDSLERRGYKVTLFDEGNNRIPTNFSNVAVMTEEEFQAVNKKKQLDSSVIRFEGHCFVRTDDLPKKIKKAVHPYELGEPSDFRMDAESYIRMGCMIVEKRMKEIEKIEGIVILNSGFLQTPLNDILFRKGTDEQALAYIEKIADTYTKHDAVCVYLDRNNVEASIDIARKKKGEDWYRHEQHLEAKTGSRNHIQRMYKLEKEILNSNMIPWTEYVLTA